MMKKITITIATRNRLEKLRRCLASIPKLDWVTTWVYCDADEKTFHELIKEDIWVGCSLKHLGCAQIQNIMSASGEDGLLCLVDDATLYAQTLQIAIDSFNEHFPDDDGMLGLGQDGTTGSPWGLFLLGQKFLQRFPGKQISFPGYWHFGDMEIHALADKLGKFHFEPAARVYHFHPDEHPEEKDQTHIDARVWKTEDFALFRERELAGLLWGDQ